MNDDTIKRLQQAQAEKTQQELSDARFDQQTAQMAALQKSFTDSIGALIQFLDGKTSKTEVINQLQSISTPDVQYVVEAVERLNKSVKAGKVDLKPISEELKGIREQLVQVPKEYPDAPEQSTEIKVNNLSKLEELADKTLKSIDNLELVVPAPDVNVDAPDFKPILKGMQSGFVDLSKNIADLTKEAKKSKSKDMEKQLTEANKLLKKISEKRFGGSGGGGSIAPFVNSDGSPLQVAVNDLGEVPVSTGAFVKYQFRDLDETTTPGTMYIGKIDTKGSWLVQRYVGNQMQFASIVNNVTQLTYGDAYANRTTLTYGLPGDAF